MAVSRTVLKADFSHRQKLARMKKMGLSTDPLDRINRQRAICGDPADYDVVADYPVIVLDPKKTSKIKSKLDRLY